MGEMSISSGDGIISNESLSQDLGKIIQDSLKSISDLSSKLKVLENQLLIPEAYNNLKDSERIELYRAASERESKLMQFVQRVLSEGNRNKLLGAFLSTTTPEVIAVTAMSKREMSPKERELRSWIFEELDERTGQGE